MKKWIFILGLFLLLTGNGWATAIVQTTDYISFPVVALDSVTGVECVPESVHVHVWRGSLTNTTVYSFREVGDGADLAQIDSVATGYAGAVPQQYYFHDQVQDIDGDGTAGVYTINVRLWRGTTPTSNWFSFQIVTQSLNDAITAVTVTLDDSLGAAKQAIAAVIDDSLGNTKNLTVGTNTAVAVSLDDSLGLLKQWGLVLLDDSLGNAKNLVVGTNTAVVVLLDDSLGLLKQWGLVILDDSLGSVKNTLHGGVDVVKISGDATAADNLEDAYDHSQLTKVYIRPDGNDTNTGKTWATARATLYAGLAACGTDSVCIIYVGAGTYPAQACTVNANNRYFVGAGAQTTIITSPNGKHLFEVGWDKGGDATTYYHFGIEGLTLVGGDTVNTYGINLRKVEYFYVRDCILKEFKKGIYTMNTAGYGTIESCYCFGNTWDGMFVGGYNIIIRDNIVDSLFYASADGIALGNTATSCIVINNYIRTNNSGIRNYHAGSNYIAHNFVSSPSDTGAFWPTYASGSYYVGNQSKTGRNDTTSTLQDDIDAVDDTIQVHAPHGDDWSGSGAAGADTSDIKSMIQKNWDSDTDGELSAEPHGTGTRTVVIQCLDYTDSTTGISSVMIDVYDSTGGEYKVPLQSNTSGLCTLSLDDGRYTIHLKKTADAIDGGSPQYRGVASDTTHTFYVDQFDPGAPPSADKCRVWCLVYDLENNPIAGARLTIQVPGRFMPLVYDGTPVSRYTVSAVSNDTGYVFLDIYEMEGTNRIKCQADTSLTVTANIELRIPNKDVVRTYKAIPDATDWEIIW